MPIGECMAKHTHRQFLTWMVWLKLQWNKPSRSDYYLMQLEATVRGLFQSGAKVRPIQFEDRPIQETNEEGGLTKQQIIEANKNRHIGLVTAVKSRTGKTLELVHKTRPRTPEDDEWPTRSSTT